MGILIHIIVAAWMIGCLIEFSYSLAQIINLDEELPRRYQLFFLAIVMVFIWPFFAFFELEVSEIIGE